MVVGDVQRICQGDGLEAIVLSRSEVSIDAVMMMSRVQKTKGVARKRWLQVEISVAHKDVLSFSCHGSATQSSVTQVR